MTCPDCKSLKTKFFFEAWNVHGTQKLSKEKFVILKCQSCGLVFPRIAPGKDFYKKYYPKNYYVKNNLLFRFVPIQRIYQAIYLIRSRILVRRLLKADRVLDFGCGRAEFLTSLPKSFEKYGVEINSQAVKFVKKNFPQIKIYKDLSDLKRKRIKFNLITLWHVIEHLDNPKKILGDLTRLLEKDGLLIFSTPNSDSLGLKIAQADWFHLDTPRHLAIFNPDNLAKLCRSVGLKVIKIEGVWLEYPFDLFHSVYSRYKNKNSVLKRKSSVFIFLLYLFVLPISLIFKWMCLFEPKKSEVIRVICKRK